MLHINRCVYKEENYKKKKIYIKKKNVFLKTLNSSTYKKNMQNR